MGVSGESTHMMRKRWGNHCLGRTTSWWLPPPPICRVYVEVWSSLFPTHLLQSPSPSSRCSTSWSSAWWSHDRIVSPSHHVVVLLEFLVDLLLQLPCWIKGTKVVIKFYMCPSTEALPTCSVDLYDLESTSTWLHYPRDLISLTLLVFEGMFF